MLDPVKVQVKTADMRAMQFVTNNEVRSPQMNAIVDWLNQGQSKMVAWHNGTSIFVNTQHHSQVRMEVGDWVIKDSENSFPRIITKDDFERNYDIVQVYVTSPVPRDVINDWRRDSAEAGMVRILYRNPEYRLMGETINGMSKWYAKYPSGMCWYKAGGINPGLSSDAIDHLQHLQVIESHPDVGYRLTPKGKQLAIEMFEGK